MRPRRHRLGLALVALVGCVFAFRGEAELAGEHDLAGIATVRVDLPSTPMQVTGCDPTRVDGCPEQLRYTGRVLSTGGNAKDARDNARAMTLVFERDGALGRLQADVPLAVRGLVELELAAMELPADRDVDLHTDLGDVEVRAVTGAVTVEIGIGDIVVSGADGGIAVHTDEGDIDIAGAGHVDASTGTGRVTIEQQAPRDVVVHAGGDVEVVLFASGDVDLDLVGERGVSVRTASVTALADRSLRRTVGTGVITVEIRAAGRIRIVDRD
jgi:hypothetical protein